MRAIFSIFFILLTVGAVLAAPPRQLPDRLDLVSSSGAQIDSPQLMQQGNWMIVYLSGTPSDTELLGAMEGLHGTQAAGKVTVIVPSATVEELNQLRTRHDKLTGLNWTVDTGRSAADSLQLPGTAMIIGLRGGDIQWTFAGSGMENKRLRSLLTDWVLPRQPLAADPAPPSPGGAVVESNPNVTGADSNSTNVNPSSSSPSCNVRINGGGCYPTITAAYAVAKNGDILEARGISLTDSPSINRPISVTIQGGFAADFASRGPGSGMIKGITISSGSLVVDNFVIN